MNWWDKINPDRATTEREREDYGKQLYEVAVSKASTAEQRANAYREWLMVVIVPGMGRGKE